MGRLGRLRSVGDREDTPTTAPTRGSVPEPRPAGGPLRPRPVPDWEPKREPVPPGPARRAAQAVRAWSRGPNGRLVLPGALLLGLIGVTAAAGALVLPATAPPTRAADAATATPGPTLAVPSTAPPPITAVPGLPASPLPTAPATAPPPTVGPTAPPFSTGRPSDVLATWAQQLSPRVTIPAAALQAYGYAELVVARTTPACGLRWTTLAAIGFVESGHGSANGASLVTTGQALPPIIGLPLDGNGGRQLIRDTDSGQLDNDAVYDRAVGPMQFIPSTWRTSGIDADNDGAKDPHDIDDASLAAANYLCSNARNLATPSGWWSAILSYNDVQRYAQQVYDKANAYGTLSRVA
jgi:membrane-bound lytic murein transglycosylase B